MYLREFEVIFQLQYLKGATLFASKFLCCFLVMNCSEEEISSRLHGAKSGRDRIWSLLSGAYFNLEFFRNGMQLKISDDIFLLNYETGCKTRPFGQQNDQKLK